MPQGTSRFDRQVQLQAGMTSNRVSCCGKRGGEVYFARTHNLPLLDFLWTFSALSAL